eukprot:1157588-Pelagomonas_calceolata.AAC.6
MLPPPPPPPPLLLVGGQRCCSWYRAPATQGLQGAAFSLAKATSTASSCTRRGKDRRKAMGQPFVLRGMALCNTAVPAGEGHEQ